MKLKLREGIKFFETQMNTLIIYCKNSRFADFSEMGAGKTWREVPWIGFRHKLCRDELVAQFGEEIGNAVKLDSTDDDDVEGMKDERLAQSFRTAEVFEIWDKEESEVVFVTANYKDAPTTSEPAIALSN